MVAVERWYAESGWCKLFIVCSCLLKRNPTLHTDDFQYFGSGAGVYELSNFCDAPFELWGYNWASSEHAYQAAYRCEKADWARFAVGGDLGTLTKGIGKVFAANDVTKKAAYWGAKKSKKAMVGIIAKMAVKPERARKLGLRLRKWSDDARDMTEMRVLFTEILLAKYRANAEHKAKLLSTYSKVLVEFDRGAGRATAVGKPPLWTGLVVDGRVAGQNLMGKLMMEVRETLQKEEAVASRGEPEKLEMNEAV